MHPREVKYFPGDRGSLFHTLKILEGPGKIKIIIKTHFKICELIPMKTNKGVNFSL